MFISVLAKGPLHEPTWWAVTLARPNSKDDGDVSDRWHWRVMVGQIFRIGTVRYDEGLWRIRRHGPVIAHCTDSEDFPMAVADGPTLRVPALHRPTWQPVRSGQHDLLSGWLVLCGLKPTSSSFCWIHYLYTKYESVDQRVKLYLCVISAH